MAFNWRFRDAARLTAPTLMVAMLLLGAVHAQEPIEPEPFDPTVPFDPGAPVDPSAPDTIEPDPDAMEEPAPDAAQPAPDAVEPAPAVPAKPIKNPIAEFAGIDKITGRIITFDVYIDETVQFGALQVTPRVCYSRPKEEEPKTDSFVEVDEITLDRKIQRIFTGWMFAESPGLNAVEHAVYDVWLKACKQKSDVPPPETPKTN